MNVFLTLSSWVLEHLPNVFQWTAPVLLAWHFLPLQEWIPSMQIPQLDWDFMIIAFNQNLLLPFLILVDVNHQTQPHHLLDDFSHSSLWYAKFGFKKIKYVESPHLLPSLELFLKREKSWNGGVREFLFNWCYSAYHRHTPGCKMAPSGSGNPSAQAGQDQPQHAGLRGTGPVSLRPSPITKVQAKYNL